MGDSTPTEVEPGVPLPLVEEGVSRLDEAYTLDGSPKKLYPENPFKLLLHNFYSMIYTFVKIHITAKTLHRSYSEASLCVRNHTIDEGFGDECSFQNVRRIQKWVKNC